MSLPRDALYALYTQRASKADGDHAAGLEYDYELAGPEGARYLVFGTAETPPEQWEAAAASLRARFDVLRITYHTIPAAWLEEERFRPEDYPLPQQGWLDAARTVVRTKGCCRVHPETYQRIPERKQGGILLDLYSASALCCVYDSLRPENQAKFLALALDHAVQTAFALLQPKGDHATA